MAWLQENWIIAVVGLVVAVVLLWLLFGRRAPQEIETPAAPPAEPRKPLEAVKPEIIAAEPARFKPREPAPAPVAAAPPPPPPAPEPVAEAPPAPEPEPVPDPAPEPEPVAEIPEEPTVPAEPVAEAPVPAEPEPEPEPQPEPAPAPEPEPEPAAIAPEEPTVPPPAPEPVPEVVATPEPAAAPATTSDNLQLLKGVGPKMVVLLNGLGVTSFQQIADWTDADVAAIDPQLGAFQGRIARDAIVDQAGYLARGDKAGFEAKYGALGGEL
ncbi:hypothetical protein ATE67_06730 [Sphingopyxis sp. H050]|jgi:predicted flap endonuclease-1-like 5' DNA nuclease|uniref:hypothetical protein n=1 Tax=Sphingopyxis sp. H050 TaxID=1759072 RepID=UPI0007360875|nr:hypothetical protein [Sphingopyxis sp. H050]KTE21025.1 hypothetical protein ATE67_06730 [Sphingopyxis sp. H050]